jgi:hypothetical protein
VKKMLEREDKGRHKIRHPKAVAVAELSLGTNRKRLVEEEKQEEAKTTTRALTI